MTPSLDVIESIEKHGYELVRKGEYQLGVKVLALVLDWRRGEVTVAPSVFACDIDESAGMAEVVELQGWSKRVPCA